MFDKSQVLYHNGHVRETNQIWIGYHYMWEKPNGSPRYVCTYDICHVTK